MTPHRPASSLAALTLGAIGVVYGDIGTSPLYALKEVFAHGHVPLTPDNIYGVLSLVFWTLTVVVSLKYVMLILRADNNGEGGLIAMLALASQAVKDRPALRRRLLLLGIFGTAIFFGDGVITPAISVLSAVEGLEVAAPALHRFVVPLTLVVLTALFIVQRLGTGQRRPPVRAGHGAVVRRAGRARAGAHRRRTRRSCGRSARTTRCASWSSQPGDRLHRARLGRAVRHRRRGAVRRHGPLRQAADPPGLVQPGDAGAGAQLLRPGRDAAASTRRTSRNPFYEMAPTWALYPLIGLATCATVIASQALITAAFSVTKQAIQLGYLPRLRIPHTSVKETGQIYVPFVNWSLYVCIVLAVIVFGSSSKLAAAYGIAVTIDMLITTTMTFFVIRYGWKYPWSLCFAATGFFFVVDFIFFAPTSSRCSTAAGSRWCIGAVMFTLMMTWKQGRRLMRERLRDDAIDLKQLPRRGVRQPADARAGHGGVPGQRAGHHAERAAAQPEAQQGAARDQPVRHRRSTTRCRGSASTSAARSSRWATTAGR